MSKRGPTRSTSDLKLTPLQDAIERPERIDPRSAPELRGHSVATRDELRGMRGSMDGNAGPRAVILAGNSDPLDAGVGVFVWDPTSRAADDDVNTLQPMGDEEGRWRRAPSGGQRGVRVLTNGTTSYTPTAGTRDIIVEGWAGGGAGGGSPIAGASLSSCGAGGGSGGYFRKRIANIGAGPFTVAIGAGGVGASAAIGGTGGDTTFNDGTTTYTAKAGTGGQPGGPASAAVTVSQAGGGGAVSTNGDVNGAGNPGGFGLVTGALTGVVGSGGATSLGGARGGSTVSAATSFNGVAAIANTGSGGGGGYSNNAAASTGGNGATGLIVITEIG